MEDLKQEERRNFMKRTPIFPINHISFDSFLLGPLEKERGIRSITKEKENS